MAHDSQIVTAIENLKLATVGPAKDKHQAPTNGLKLYVRAVIESEASIKEENHSYNPLLGLQPGMQTVALYPCCIPLFDNVYLSF